MTNSSHSIALYHNLPSGGAKRAVYEWVSRLSNRHSIDVYTLSTADHEYCDIRSFTHQHRVYPFTPRGLFNSPFGRLNHYQRWRDILELEHIHKQIADDINQGGYDLVFVNPSLYTQVPPLLEHLSLPSIYYLHEPVGKANQRSIQRPYINPAQDKSLRARIDQIDITLAGYRKKLDGLQNNNLRAARLILANSEFTRQQMQLAYTLDSKVCYLGVDANLFRPLPEIQKGNIVLSVGELAPRKGFDFLIESLRLIPVHQRPALRLASNWEDKRERAYLTELAAQYQVELSFLGRMDNSTLRMEYNQAKLCLYSPVKEPFGLVPLEAMACGVPVVGVNEGGVRETILDQETGRLVSRDPAHFASAIQELLADPIKLQRFGEQSREHVLRNWSWEVAVEKLESYLN